MMFIIIRLAFVSLILIYSSDCQKYTLNTVYNQIIEGSRVSKSESLNTEIQNDSDKNCIKNYLKIARNGKLTVNNIERVILHKVARLKCLSNEDKFFKQLLESFTITKSSPDCYKWHLQQLEPLSPLVKDFDSNLVGEAAEKCKKNVPNFERIKVKIGSIQEFTCGAITDPNDFIKFVYKIFILNSDELNAEVNKIETDKMIANLKLIAYKTADCILKRIDDDAEGLKPNHNEYTTTAEIKNLTVLKQIELHPKKSIQSDHFTPTNYWETVEKINNGYRVCVILRGLPGSGKSHIAKRLIEDTIGYNFEEHIVSADNYFIKNGIYNYDISKSSEAHRVAQTNFTIRASKGYSPLIVDNTNLNARAMYPYFQIAIKYDYHIAILEADTPWKWAPNKLVQKNVHNVPIEIIEKMKMRYEKIASVEEFAKSHLNLDIIKDPKMRDIPKFSPKSDLMKTICEFE